MAHNRLQKKAWQLLHSGVRKTRSIQRRATSCVSVVVVPCVMCETHGLSLLRPRLLKFCAAGSLRCPTGKPKPLHDMQMKYIQTCHCHASLARNLLKPEDRQWICAVVCSGWHPVVGLPHMPRTLNTQSAPLDLQTFASNSRCCMISACVSTAPSEAGRDHTRSCYMFPTTLG